MNNQFSNKTAQFIYLVCKYIYICSNHNFWFESLDWSENVSKLIDKSSRPIDLIMYSLLVSEIFAFSTQKGLSEKQANDQILFVISHLILYSSFLASVFFHKGELKNIVQSVSISLKTIYNDEKVEKQMMRWSKRYMVSYFLYVSMAVLFYGLDALFQAVTTEATFTTIIPAWPDVQDRSNVAGAFRVIVYFIWLLFVIRTSAIYSLTLVLTIGLNHQYKNLRYYFQSLNKIFDQNLEQTEKEKEYEMALQVGIQLHARTLSCVRVAKHAFKVLFSGQILLSVLVLVLLMLQMTSTERSITNTLTSLSTAGSVLFITGMFMWNAGDITVEASRLPDAMFSSGWHNCYGSTGHRVRRMLTLAMAQGQIPVLFKVFGVIDLSYASYLSIVKTSYSVFTVLY